MSETFEEGQDVIALGKLARVISKVEGKDLWDLKVWPEGRKDPYYTSLPAVNIEVDDD